MDEDEFKAMSREESKAYRRGFKDALNLAAIEADEERGFAQRLPSRRILKLADRVVGFEVMQVRKVIG